MAHRGRLNVLAHVLQKPYAQILAEFKDPVAAAHAADRSRVDGRREVSRRRPHRRPARSDARRRCRRIPSHLEAVNPVVVGHGARGGHGRRRSPGRRASTARCTLPILIHGDAAFPGQGIVAETLNLSRLSGYDTGGTIHIIANNQLGFTATPAESYSTSYASGLARGFKIPIVHVNADDPAACLEAARLAWEYRARFGRDFLIDLIGYRRYGHNEGDEPAFTQPLMYKTGRGASRPCASCLREHAGRSRARSPRERGRGAGRRSTSPCSSRRSSRSSPKRTSWRQSRSRCPPGIAGQTRNGRARSTGFARSTTALLARPEGFTFHKKLERGRERRKRLLANPQRANGRLGGRRGAGVCDDPRRRHSDPPDRRGRRARHVQPSPCGLPRRRERQAVRPAAGVRAGARVVRDPQQPAQRERRRSASSSATTSRNRTGW